VFSRYDPARAPVADQALHAGLCRPKRVQQLIAEFERLIAAELYAPALNTPLATGIADGRAYLVYEYVAASRSISRSARYRPAPPAHAVRVCAQLAGALDLCRCGERRPRRAAPARRAAVGDDIRLTGVGISRALERSASSRRSAVRTPRRSASQALSGIAAPTSSASPRSCHELLWGRRISGSGRKRRRRSPRSPRRLPRLRARVCARARPGCAGSVSTTALGFAEALSEALPDLATEASAAASGRRARRFRPTSVATRLRRRPLLPLDEATEPAERDHVGVARHAVPEPPASPRLRPLRRVRRHRPIRRICTRSQPKRNGTATSKRRHRSSSQWSRPVRRFRRICRLSRRRASSGASGDPCRCRLRRRWPSALGLGFFGGYGARWRIGQAPPTETAATETPQLRRPPSRPALRSSRRPRQRRASQAASSRKPPVAPPSAAACVAVDGAAEQRGCNTAGTAETRGDERTAGPGRILVRSTPAGARVVVDGASTDRHRLRCAILPTGTHRVRVTHDGYATAERRVSISASRPAQSLTIPLQRAGAAQEVASRAPVTTGGVERFVGTLVVDSRPAGARVFLDGRAVGSTPLSMREVRAGEHAVRLEHDGYRRWSGSVRVVAAEQNRVTASLER
jgi:hypothetical protein